MANALVIREDNWLDVRRSASEVPMPYRKEILLDELEVDGTLHVDDILAKTEHLSVGDDVVLKRDLAKGVAPLAVSVENKAGERIGFLPEKFVAPYAHLLDAGKLLVAKVAAKELDGHWLNLRISIYLKDF